MIKKRGIKVLMFGWDFPPIKNGGLGVACLGLTKALSDESVDITFVLPREQEVESELDFVFAGVEGVDIRPVHSSLLPYRASGSFLNTGNGLYSHTLIEEVERYAAAVPDLISDLDFDVIHAHDWTTYLAGMAAKRATGKPLVLHVHATCYDQAGGQSVDPAIYHIEGAGFDEADKIVAISERTKQTVKNLHPVSEEKIEVVHNGIEQTDYEKLPPLLEHMKKRGTKIVLYHGRITIQKGPDYFVEAARKVKEYYPNVHFIMSGWGDMREACIRHVSESGLSQDFTFVDSPWGQERSRIYQAADMLVMPSVSEPFGLVPLEAIQEGTPVIISKQSGVSEVLSHALKVDFWDTDELTNKIVTSLKHPELLGSLAVNSGQEVKGITWGNSAKKILNMYKGLLAQPIKYA